MGMDFEAGSNNYVAIGACSCLQARPGGTVCFWANVESWVNNENFAFHASINGLTTSARLSVSAKQSTGNKFRTTSRRLDADSASILDTTVNYSTGVWYFVAAVSDWTNGQQRIYINGVQQNSQAVASWTGNSSNTASGAEGVGNRGDYSTTSDFDGILRDVRVYGRALSANEILSLYNQRGGDGNYNGLQHRWNLNEGYAGQTASGAGTARDVRKLVNGTPTNSPVYVAVPGIAPRRRAA